MADNGHDITMPTRLGPQNAKAILGIMIRDALDETGKNFLRLILGRVFMVGATELPVARMPFCSSRRLGGNIGWVTLARISNFSNANPTPNGLFSTFRSQSFRL